MVRLVVSVRDAAVNAFMQPFYVVSAGQAIRSFDDECNNKSSELWKHAGDYELFLIAEFNEESGTFVNMPSPKSLARAVDFRRKDGD